MLTGAETSAYTPNPGKCAWHPSNIYCLRSTQATLSRLDLLQELAKGHHDKVDMLLERAIALSIDIGDPITRVRTFDSLGLIRPQQATPPKARTTTRLFADRRFN